MKAMLNIEGASPQTVEAIEKAVVAIEKAVVAILNTHGNTWGELWLKSRALKALRDSVAAASPNYTTISGCNFQGLTSPKKRDK